jgi:hypothetical protein
MATERSSTSGLLAGTLYGGRPISHVTRGKGAVRRLHFTTGRPVQVTRGELHELAKLNGLMAYRARYVAAPTREKRRMLATSKKRQQAILRNHIRRLEARLVHAPEPVRARIQADLTRLSQARVGSPLIGRPTATDFIAPRRTRQARVAKNAGIRFVTIGTGARRRVIPIRE